jgi:hypothetical protein
MRPKCVRVVALLQDMANHIHARYALLGSLRHQPEALEGAAAVMPPRGGSNEIEEDGSMASSGKVGNSS